MRWSHADWEGRMAWEIHPVEQNEALASLASLTRTETKHSTGQADLAMCVPSQDAAARTRQLEYKLRSSLG